jgi:transposase-like protein
MSTSPSAKKHKKHRFPVDIIRHAVWLYFRFCLSFRDVEELLCERGVIVTYEAIRKWCRKFGQPYANQLRRRRPRQGDKWHLDEVSLTIKGEHHYLWRAVDQDGSVLDILVQRRRDKTAAKKFFRKLLKGLTYAPRIIVTDKFKSYGAAKRELLPGVDELWSFVGRKANRQWVWIAMDAMTRQIIAFHVGDRSRQSAQELWEKIPAVYQEQARFYTDCYEVYKGIIPSAHHRAITKCLSE